jgi:hypothetical protein
VRGGDLLDERGGGARRELDPQLEDARGCGVPAVQHGLEHEGPVAPSQVGSPAHEPLEHDLHRLVLQPSVEEHAPVRQQDPRRVRTAPWPLRDGSPPAGGAARDRRGVCTPRSEAPLPGKEHDVPVDVARRIRPERTGDAGCAGAPGSEPCRHEHAITLHTSE